MSDINISPNKLKQSILQEAMQGKLTQQSSQDGDASDLLQSIAKEKKELIKAGKIKKQKELAPVKDDEKPFKIPNNWKWTHLEYFARLENGDRGKNYPGKKYWINSGVPFINAGALSDEGFIDKSNLNYISDDRFNLLKSGLVDEGDILYTLRGSVGRIGLNTNISKGAIASSLTIIKPLGIDSYFLRYIFLSPLNVTFLRQNMNGTAQPNLSAKKLNDFIVPIPPLEEQKRIVDKLDELLPKVASLKQSVDSIQSLRNELLSRLRRSLLQSAMQGKLTQQSSQDGNASDLLQSINEEKQRLIKAGKIKKQKELTPIRNDEKSFSIPDNWQWARLGDIGLITSGGTPRRSNPEYWNAKSIPWITPKLLGSNQNHKLLHDVDQYISEIGLKESSAQFIEKGSIVFSSRAPIGYINIVDFNYSTNQGAKSITPFKINQTYLYYSLKERTEAIKKQGSGTTFKEISKTALSNFLIPIPPLAEQKRIVDKLDSMFEHIDNM